MKIIILVISIIMLIVSFPVFLKALLNLGSTKKRILLLFAVFSGEPFDIWHGMFIISLLGLAYVLFS